MAAGKRISKASRSLRRIRRMEDDFGVETLPRFGRELYSLDGSGTLWQTWTLLSDRTKAGFFAAGLLHAAHHAVMPAIPAAAGGKVRLGIRGKEGRDQQQAEDNQQRIRDRTAHKTAANLAQTEIEEFDLGQGLRPFSTSRRVQVGWAARSHELSLPASAMLCGSRWRTSFHGFWCSSPFSWPIIALKFEEGIMDRRGVLYAMGAAAVSSSALPGIGQDMSHHNMAGMGGAKYQMLIDVASTCASAAERCTSHCIEMLASGDKTLAACAASSREVAVVCGGLRSLAAQNSAHLASYARVAAEVCKSCEAECRKHPQHSVCKDCADACAACAIECGKV